MVLLGTATIALGFLLRFNPLLVVVALITGVAAGKTPGEVLALFGHSFNDARYVTAVYLVLPVIGLLERYGLQARARTGGRLARGHGGTIVACLPLVPAGDRRDRTDQHRRPAR